MKIEIGKQNALIGDKIYFFTTKEELELAVKRDNIIDKMIAIQDKLGHACMRDIDWTNLRFKLMNIESKLKKTCAYLNREDSKVFENGGAITENQIIKQY